MEGRKQPGSSSSSSSFTSELFGSKDSSSSSGILGSIFGPSPKYAGDHGVDKEKRDAASQYWRPRSGIPDDIPQSSEEANPGAPNRDVNLYYQEEKMQPCHLSSSIYYGGQDVYSRPKNSQSSYTTFNKDSGEDDSGSASRGNWWKGMLLRLYH